VKEASYYRQSELILEVLPLIDRYDVFALKGGTAINFFVRDLPRLSVDIDLTYLPVTEREQALTDITETLGAIQRELRGRLLVQTVTPMTMGRTEYLKGLVVTRQDATIKIEPNLVIRGAVYPPRRLKLCSTAETFFERAVEIQVLSPADLYGGKICAALDRQHPRDLFDVKLLLEAEGFTENVRKAFVVYLISHDRPMVELLNPHRKELSDIFAREFQGMTRQSATVPELVAAREEIVKLIHETLTDEERRFIVSVKEGEPRWDLLGVNGIRDLPAIQWKLRNIGNMLPSGHRQALEKLRRYLNV
jgi:predicted nucleotidyltransferase component of viral defense system